MYITRRHKFSKHERLKSPKQIKFLLKEGKKVVFYPIRLVYFRCENQNKGSHQVYFSIAKHKVKRAVKRNKIKRILRETYRLNKHILYESIHSKNMAVCFLMAYVYIGNAQLDLIAIRKQLMNSLLYLKQIPDHKQTSI